VSLSLVLRHGKLRTSASLRRRASSSKLPKLKFKLRVTDAAGKTFKLTRKIRPRS
jgi:hypothetical protein